MAYLKKCTACNTYTMRDQCPACGSPTGDPEPPKFSHPDTYGDYRRETKQKTREDGE